MDFPIVLELVVPPSRKAMAGRLSSSSTAGVMEWRTSGVLEVPPF